MLYDYSYYFLFCAIISCTVLRVMSSFCDWDPSQRRVEPEYNQDVITEVDVVLGGQSYTIPVDAHTPAVVVVDRFIEGERQRGNLLSLNQRQQARLQSAVEDARNL